MIINNLTVTNCCALLLCDELSGCAGCLLSWALLGAMSHVLALEASSFFDAALFVFSCHLVNLNYVDIHHIWVMLCTCVTVFLHELSPALLHLGVLELEAS
jgi:hypothetical protein